MKIGMQVPDGNYLLNVSVRATIAEGKDDSKQLQDKLAREQAFASVDICGRVRHYRPASNRPLAPGAEESRRDPGNLFTCPTERATAVTQPWERRRLVGLQAAPFKFNSPAGRRRSQDVTSPPQLSSALPASAMKPMPSLPSPSRSQTLPAIHRSAESNQTFFPHLSLLSEPPARSSL